MRPFLPVIPTDAPTGQCNGDGDGPASHQEISCDGWAVIHDRYASHPPFLAILAVSRPALCGTKYSIWINAQALHVFRPFFLSATPSPLPSTRLPEISFTSNCTLFWLGVLAIRASSSILKGVEFDYEAPGSSFLTVLAYSILILITTLSNDAIPDSRVKAPVTTPLCYDVLAFGLPLSSSTVTISNGPPNT
ncbi:hypothetical protein D9758_005306 [Tetrapyrgos nigripes]|uniref:Uncharacterized protein n=1 Tax=Tetrapyrgos nigripes TaxID=182062 RepID=A0A8H5GWL1_9AGAR|nr:hypothetical protein D9758_005306 [Tetrapyrgos nigripes]